ncbi:hypothetical protein niasHT_015490 [Heterodera trifolii]|uniref:EGF-like domain-containing protein n=1 Tax=Heterodera trifolii TaxID=157864 RepID=A0ABD2L081_9BILA
MHFHFLLLLVVFLFRSVILCQNVSAPSVFANDSSPPLGTLSNPSGPFPTVEAEQMAPDHLLTNITQPSGPNATVLVQQIGVGNGTEPIVQNDPSNGNNESAVVAGPSLVEEVANISMTEPKAAAENGTMISNSTKGSGEKGTAESAKEIGKLKGKERDFPDLDGAPTPLSVPTPQVQLQQKAAVVSQIPSNNFGNSPLVFEAQTCSADDCSGRGTCIGTKTFPVCLCNGGSAGTRCQDAPCDPSVNCNSRGFCIGTIGIASCFCNIGFTGSQCQFQSGK